MTVTRESHDERETMDLAARLARRLTGGKVICLEGPLGAGKTCFVRGLAGGLGLDASDVCSPSFVICRRYAGQGRLGLVHVDAFRLAGPQDLEAIGWDELLEATDSVIAVEWPSRIEAALPADRIEIALAHTGESSRRLTLSGPAALVSDWEQPDRPCPGCGKPAPPSAPTFPFCSERCRLVDLGRWMDEKYRIPQRDQSP